MKTIVTIEGNPDILLVVTQKPKAIMGSGNEWQNFCFSPPFQHILFTRAVPKETPELISRSSPNRKFLISCQPAPIWNGSIDYESAPCFSYLSRSSFI